MIEILSLKMYVLVSFVQQYSEWFVLIQIGKITGVFTMFEYHWQRFDDEEFFLRNKALYAASDLKTYNVFKLGFIAIPFLSLWLFGRALLQKGDSEKFLRDYATKRIF